MKYIILLLLVVVLVSGCIGSEIRKYEIRNFNNSIANERNCNQVCMADTPTLSNLQNSNVGACDPVSCLCTCQYGGL